MIYVLGPAEEPEELHGPGGPAGHVVCQGFQQGKGPLAATVMEGVGHLAARDQDPVECLVPGHAWIARFACIVDGSIPYQIADIGDDPVLCCLDEPVLVQPVHIFFNRLDLFGYDAQKRPQRIPLVGIAHAMDHREKLV